MNLRKINLIIGREFLIRVRKKSFLLVTFLTPLLMAAMITVPTLLSLVKDDTSKHIEVIDPTGIAQAVLTNDDYTLYTFKTTGDLEAYKADFANSGLYAVCVVEPTEGQNVDVRMYSTGQIDGDLQRSIGRLLEKEVERRKLESYNIPELPAILQDISTKISVKSLTWTETGDEKETITEVYMGIAYIASFLIYMFIFMYGSMVIRGVIEEKTNRIVEVIISSVKPVELMLGKIVGVALVALLQFILWILLTVVIVIVVMATVGAGIIPTEAAAGVAQLDGLSATIASFDSGNGTLTAIASTLSQFNLVEFIISFFLFFIGGYLMYASMFAAVGSVSDAETDTQQFQMPITIPLILGLFIMLHTFQHPDSSLSVWASLIPFTSPMVMLARLPFGGVPFWQLALSLVLLFATFLAVVYFSAKIYRVGILLYGKKVTWAELWKWMRYKNA